MKKKGIKEKSLLEGEDLLEERKKTRKKCIIGCNTQTLYARD